MDEKYQRTLKLYDDLIGSHPDIERKGKTMPYTSVNGHMFSQINKAGELGLRLSPEEYDKFLTDHQSGPFMSYGAVMREYVLIPESLLNDIEALSSYLDLSYQYVKSLKPKTSKK